MSKKSDRLDERLRKTTWRPVSDEARDSHLARIDAAVGSAASVPRSIRVRRRFTTIAVAAAMLVLPAGIAVAAEGSLPGDVLYPVKKVTETLRGWVDSDVAAEHRVEELEELVDQDAPVAAIEAQLQRAQEEVDRLATDHELRPRFVDVAEGAADEAVRGDVAVAEGTDRPIRDGVEPAPSSSTTVRPSDSTTSTRPATTVPSDAITTDGTTTTTIDGSITVVTSPPTIVPAPTTVPPPSTTLPPPSTTVPPDVDRNRVVGYVHAGPTCPVERFPPDPDCADRPVMGAVMIITAKDGAEVERVESNVNGRFSLQLPSGAYRLLPQPVDGLLGTAPEQRFVVEHQVIELDVAYDTGIR